MKFNSRFLLIRLNIFKLQIENLKFNFLDSNFLDLNSKLIFVNSQDPL